MPVSVDLNKAWRHQRHGDLVAVLTWVNDERTIVLIPALRRDAGWYMVAESAAYLWGVDHPDQALRREAMEHAVEQSHIACSMLGLEPSRMNRAKVISVIAGWLPDLLRMPTGPEPELSSASYGNMILRADGMPIAGRDIRDEIQGGASYG